MLKMCSLVTEGFERVKAEEVEAAPDPWWWCVVLGCFVVEVDAERGWRVGARGKRWPVWWRRGACGGVG